MRTSKDHGGRRAHLLRVGVLCAAAILLAAACRQKDEAPATTTGIDTAIVPAGAVSVADIDIGKGLNPDKTLKTGTDDFGVRDTIYAVVKTQGAGTDTQLAAKWTFQDGQTVHESAQTVSLTGDALHEFHIDKATAWPAGKYKVEIILNGASAGTKDFEVK